MKPGPNDLERVLQEHQLPPAARQLIEDEIRRLREPPELEHGRRARALAIRDLLDTFDNAAALALAADHGVIVPASLWDQLVAARACVEVHGG